MDWAKAKNILIIVFLVLNISLLGAIVVSRLGQGVNIDAVNSTKEILNGNNITIRCEIPSYDQKTPSLEYESNRLDRSGIADKLLGKEQIRFVETEKGEKQVKGSKTLYFKNHDTFIFTDEDPDTAFDLEDKKKLESNLRKFMESMGLEMSSYILDRYDENEDGTVSIFFTEEYKKFLVFDNYVNITLSSKGIIRIECKYKKVKGFLNDAVDIMPAHQVLLKNFMNSKYISITAIDMGFKGYESERDMKESSEGPAWRISLQHSDPLYFSAFDGKEIEK